MKSEDLIFNLVLKERVSLVLLCFIFWNVLGVLFICIGVWLNKMLFLMVTGIV